MKSSRWAAVFVFWGVGCAGTQAGKPAPAVAKVPAAAAEPGPQGATPVAGSPVPAPDSLVVELGLANPAAHLHSLGAYANAVQPGSGAMFSPALLSPAVGEMLGVPSFDGLDFYKPVYVLLLNPKNLGDAEKIRDGLVVVGTVADANILASTAAANPSLALRLYQGFAVIGGKGGVEAAAPYALTHLVGRAPPAHPTVTVSVARIVAAYEADIAAAMAKFEALMHASGGDSGMENALKIYAAGLRSLVHQTHRAQIAAELGASMATLRIDLSVARGGSLHAFATAQAPSDYPRVARLPEGDLVMAGRINWSPLVPAFMKMNKAMWESMYGIWSEEMQRSSEALMPLLSGEMALSMSLAPDRVSFAGLMGHQDPKSVQTLMRSFWSLMNKAKGGPIQWKFRRNAFRHKGTTLDLVTSTFTKDMPAEQRQAMERVLGTSKAMSTLSGPIGEDYAFIFSKDPSSVAQALVDRGDRPRQLTAGLAEALAASRARSESVLVYLDLGRMVSAFVGAGKAPSLPPAPSTAGMSMAAGFQGGNLQLRFTVPAAAVANLQAR